METPSSNPKSLRRVVFLSNNPRFQMKPAFRFGRPVYLFNVEPNPVQVERSLHLITGALDRIEFDPQSHFIALTGTHQLLAQLMAVIGRRYRNVKVLAYSMRDASYSEHYLDITDRKDISGNVDATSTLTDDEGEDEGMAKVD